MTATECAELEDKQDERSITRRLFNLSEQNFFAALRQHRLPLEDVRVRQVAEHYGKETFVAKYQDAPNFMSCRTCGLVPKPGDPLTGDECHACYTYRRRNSKARPATVIENQIRRLAEGGAR